MLSLLAESWTWYAFAVVIVLTRYVSRWVHLGSFRSFQTEDYVMVFVFAFYTNLIVCMNIVAHLDTNLILDSDIPLLTPSSIQSRIRGSKYVVVVEQSMILTQWGCKFSLLLLYNKLTFGLKQHLAVKIVAGYTLVTLIVMESLYFGVWCRPFGGMWKVPVENVQCSAAIHHLITNAVFNISSDVMMLCIPLPLLIAAQIPKANKLILCGLFSLGIFVILCAVLNKYYSFAQPFSPMWTFWYIREASTAVYVANMPMCWSLMRQLFKLRAFNGVSSDHARTRSKSAPIATSYTGVGLSMARSSKGIKLNDAEAGASVERSERGDNGNNWWESRNADRLERSESEEHIVTSGARLGGGGGGAVPLEIWESRDVRVDRGGQGVGIVTTVTTGNRGARESDDEGMRTKLYDGKEGRSRITTTSVGSGPGRKSESDRRRPRA